MAKTFLVSYYISQQNETTGNYERVGKMITEQIESNSEERELVEFVIDQTLEDGTRSDIVQISEVHPIDIHELSVGDKFSIAPGHKVPISYSTSSGGYAQSSDHFMEYDDFNGALQVRRQELRQELDELKKYDKEKADYYYNGMLKEHKPLFRPAEFLVEKVNDKSISFVYANPNFVNRQFEPNLKSGFKTLRITFANAEKFKPLFIAKITQ